MRLDLFVKLKYESSTIILLVGIRTRHYDQIFHQFPLENEHKDMISMYYIFYV